MESLIWIAAVFCIWIAIGAPSWVIVQAVERLFGRGIEHGPLYAWATVAALIGMLMSPSSEHATHLENFAVLGGSLSAGACIGSLGNIAYQWAFSGTETEKRLVAWCGKRLDSLLESKVFGTILVGILAVVLTIGGLVVVERRVDGVPLLSPLGSWIWDAIRSMH